jgi:hypothetical protein
VIDDIRITDGAGQLLTSENAEGPTLASGPLNFQLTDATALLTEASATVLSAAAKDLDGDGYPETILTLVAPRPSTTPLQPIIIEASGRMRLAAADFFPAGVPKLKDSPMTIFADINNDGRPDLLFAEAGSDAPSLPGSGIGVAINLGGGKYRDVSSLVPADQQTTRSYAIAAGDVFGDGRIEIILPDELDGANTALLRWNGNGFDEIRNWIPQSIWKDGPALLHAHSWMSLADFDRDGRLDLLVTGQDHNPNFQIVFGGPGGFAAGTLVVLPDGPFGHTQGGPQPEGTLTTTEVSPVVVADFDNDGLPDIFAVIRNVTLFTNGCPTADPCRFDVGDSTYQVRLNQGSRKFVDVSPSPYLNLGRVEYQNLMAIDINNDGFLDVVGTYATDGLPGTSPQWATTLFLNDGTGLFQLVDGAQFLGVTTTPSNGQRWNLGSFVPTLVTPQRTEGIVYQSIPGAPAGLNLYKVVANRALGTGPDFADSASLGVPGFNEFYYLRHYPDAAAAVQRGGYPNGLAVGAGKGYLPHAPRAGPGPTVSVSATSMRFGATTTGAAFVQQTTGQTVRISQSGAGTFTWTATPSQPWIVVTPSSGSGSATLTVTIQFVPGLPTSGTSFGTIALSFAGAGNTVGPVNVGLTTIPNGTAVAPFGSFDTPADGATGIAGSIAVTGWSLDDTEVTRVRIMRDPVAGEPAGVLVSIGDAVLVDGARPDVQAGYPTLPRNSRAGWGYLMLTNFLPGLGNGTYKLSAIADDADGHSTTLGSKTITCANSAATTPFGAIDTPAQGEVVTTASLNNFGWVLSPGSRKADPPDGGAVQVVIDGALGVTPSGWINRSDLTALFPASQFSGVAKALGVATLDTTTLANGVHTISWLVTDNQTPAGAAGVGSRYFTVSKGSLTLDPSQGSLRRGRSTVIASNAFMAPPSAALRTAARDSDPIPGRRGFDPETPLQPYAVTDGRATVQSEELDRIELQVGAQGAGASGATYAGYLRVADGLAPLPVGSSLNPETGAFIWQPGVAFVGTYDLVFAKLAGSEAVARRDVRVVLNPKGSNRVGPQTIIDLADGHLLAGWAADLDSQVDRGVDTLHVWAYPVEGNRLGDPVFVGVADYGGARPDVAAVYGERFERTGYGIGLDGLTPGTYDLAVFAYSTVKGGFVPARTVRVTVR